MIIHESLPTETWTSFKLKKLQKIYFLQPNNKNGQLTRNFITRCLRSDY